MNTSSTRPARAAFAVAMAAICTFATSARADDMNQIGAQMRKVTEDAKARQVAQPTAPGQPGARNYSIQSTSNVDAELNTFISTLNAGLACASSKTAFQQQNAVLIDKVKEVLGYGQQFQSNALLRAAGAVPLAALLQAGIPVAKTFVSSCQSFGGGLTAGGGNAAPKEPVDPRLVTCAAEVMRESAAFETTFKKGLAEGKIDVSEKADLERIEAEAKALQRKAKEDKKLTVDECRSVQTKVAEGTKRLATALASSGHNAGPAKYEQVASMMKQVFTGGDLSPNSRAVKHAADVDMPARGGNPEALKTYLNSQNGIVKSWYKSNFGLSYAENTAQPPGGAGKYEQVASMMKQVFTGGDLSPNSRAVKHAADVDMPARGGNLDALKTYLNSQNGTVKNWYKTNFGLQ